MMSLSRSELHDLRMLADGATDTVTLPREMLARILENLADLEDENTDLIRTIEDSPDMFCSNCGEAP